MAGPIVDGAATAQEFPERPIEVIVPFKPGGRTDVIARLVAEKIQEDGLLSQPLVVVNVDGGAGASAVARMQGNDADGHTIMHWQHQALIAMAMDLGNFTLDDFRSIGYSGGGSPVWAVAADSEYDKLEEVIEALKAEPRSLVEAVGIGSIPHFVGAQLAKEAGFETRYVTANSGADRLRMVLGDNAQIALFAASEYLAQAEELKPLVYFGEERLEALPDVPTAVELGYDVTWANPNWWLAPAGTSDEAVEAIGAAIEQAIQDPEIVEYFESNALEAYWVPGDEADADAAEQLERLEGIAATIQ
ncbi:tripartite tricarboxylate transporter substrate binding protein [uncultured Jannaschia sp.]|uniref:tripartite tricarboxylate transporter substrate binding protein n=1 Tax=uncultured Jannaschia sp. TaxID=293347 RepID=UPI0026164231|nr:tripartite tricarboxylate transporter substrate binding protein [uncultured Jannaschia sp.]